MVDLGLLCIVASKPGTDDAFVPAFQPGTGTMDREASVPCNFTG
jgi:hypothetical protein